MEPSIKLAIVHNVFVRMMKFEKTGDVEQGHVHQFDHITLLAKGKLRVTIEGASTDFYAPHMIFIRKDKMHELTALEDGTVACCIHSLAETNQDLIDPSMKPLSTEG